MKKYRFGLLLCFVFVIYLFFPTLGSTETITAFIGSATKPALEEINRLYTELYGIEVIAHYGGSGTMLSQMKLAGQGDIYLPGSPDFMEKAKREQVIDPDSIKIVAYLIPAINVQKGNPKNITSLKDLIRDDIDLVIANPRVVCVGLYAVEIFETNNLSSPIQPKIKSYTESCARTANTIAIGGVDVVMGWRVFQYWNPDRIETVLLQAEEIPRICYIPIAVSRFSANKDRAVHYAEFIISSQSRKIFEKWGYITNEQEARKYAPHAAISGEYSLPQGW
ncbi:MAG: substrate-binding domain-containing protein [Deltaproteobacteria bacterium]|nr:substrate-binding domain-containing protein [Deltaproteobacteria bacterium]